MGVKLVFLVFSLQLWHLAMSNQIPQVLANSTDSRNTVNCYNTKEFKINNKLYQVESTLKVNWYTAAHNCRLWGGNLLNIESSSEMDLILSLIPVSSYWVSSNCLSKDRNFISIATGKPMPYNRWHAGEPNNKDKEEYCVELRRSALNDERCNNNYNYICQAVLN